MCVPDLTFATVMFKRLPNLPLVYMTVSLAHSHSHACKTGCVREVMGIFIRQPPVTAAYEVLFYWCEIKSNAHFGIVLQYNSYISNSIYFSNIYILLFEMLFSTGVLVYIEYLK